MAHLLFIVTVWSLVKPDATQEEVDRFIDSDDTSQVFAQSVSVVYRGNVRLNRDLVT